MGYLKLILGGMGAGKTRELNKDLVIYAGLNSPNFRVLYVNSSLDVRDEIMSSHAGKCTLHSGITGVKVTHLKDVNYSDYDVIGVDEAQFFDDIDTVVPHWLRHGKRVYVAGLIGDKDRQLFGKLYSLLPETDDILRLNAICKPCLDRGSVVDAPFTGCHDRLVERVHVGGLDFYIPMCRRCHDEFLTGHACV